MAIIFSSKVPNTDRTEVLQFVNMRAFAYWSLREILDTEWGQNVALPPDQELLSDLTAPRWSMTMQGRHQGRAQRRHRGAAGTVA